MTPFDSSAAWHSTRRMVAANRDALLALAGVFFLLPALIQPLVLVLPPSDPGQDPQAAAQAILAAVQAALPLLLVLTLPRLIGFLTIVSLLLDRKRPTVGAAIITGCTFVPSYVAAQCLIMVALALMFVTIVAALSVIMPAPAAGLLALALLVYPLVRVLLTGPEMMAGRLRNPVRAIGAGLVRTQGHFTAMLLYFGPALALYMVLMGLVVIALQLMVIDLPFDEARHVIPEIGAALVSAIGDTVFAAMVAATYHQLRPESSIGPAISPSGHN